MEKSKVFPVFDSKLLRNPFDKSKCLIVKLAHHEIYEANPVCVYSRKVYVGEKVKCV